MIKPIGKPWFEAKQNGYGAGWPITWEDWVTLLLFLVATFSAALWLGVGWVFGVVQTVILSAFLVITAAKTEDGWRWR